MPTPVAQVMMRVAGVVLVVSYPALVYFGLTRWSSRFVATALLLVLALRVFGTVRRSDGRSVLAVLAPILPTVLLVGVAAAIDEPAFLLAVPVLINLSLFAAFATTLRRGATPMIERFARLREPDLPPGGAAYCRVVTKAWCGFFVLNAMITSAMGWWNHAAWALYTGVIAYVLVGVMFAAEYVVRKARFRRYGAGLADRLLAAVFPPRGDVETVSR